MSESLNNCNRTVDFIAVDMHSHVASCRKALKSAVVLNLNRLCGPIARVDYDEINQTALINAVLTSDNLAFMRPKKQLLNEQGYKIQIEKSVKIQLTKLSSPTPRPCCFKLSVSVSRMNRRLLNVLPEMNRFKISNSL